MRNLLAIGILLCASTVYAQCPGGNCVVQRILRPRLAPQYVHVPQVTYQQYRLVQDGYQWRTGWFGRRGYLVPNYRLEPVQQAKGGDQ